MNVIDALAALFAILLVAATVVYNFRKMAKGESTCAYCDRCSARNACGKKPGGDEAA